MCAQLNMNFTSKLFLPIYNLQLSHSNFAHHASLSQSFQTAKAGHQGLHHQVDPLSTHNSYIHTAAKACFRNGKYIEFHPVKVEHVEGRTAIYVFMT